MTVGDKFEKVRDKLRMLEGCRERQMKYAVPDLMEWLAKDLEQVWNILDELEYDVKDFVQTRYSDPITLQLELDATYEELMERVV